MSRYLARNEFNNLVVGVSGLAGFYHFGNGFVHVLQKVVVFLWVSIEIIKHGEDALSSLSA